MEFMNMLKVRNNKRFRGFTLVEVLITLGIIGVVAAITIPLLIQNSNSKKFITQFEKSLSTLNQAAINAQAQYDMDYSLLGSINQDSACATDALSKGQDTLCGLLNNTLSGHTYQGKYGVVKGVNNSTPYQADVSSFPITDFLVFSFADGAFVAFNPNAVNCSLAPSSVISTEMVTSGNLANCLGFVDVNGSQFPNKEVKCFEEDTELSVYSTCKVTNRSMGDIFPIVFYDGVVKPITNASLSVINGGDGKEGAEEASTPTTTANGHKVGKRDDPSTWEAFKVPKGLTQEECQALPESYGVQNCLPGGDYWAAAAKECGGVNNMLTSDDLYDLSKQIYGAENCNDSSRYCSGTGDFSNLPESLSGLGSSWGLWSGNAAGSGARYRNFYNNGSYQSISSTSGSYYSSLRAICVKN